MFFILLMYISTVHTCWISLHYDNKDSLLLYSTCYEGKHILFNPPGKKCRLRPPSLFYKTVTSSVAIYQSHINTVQNWINFNSYFASHFIFKCKKKSTSLTPTLAPHTLPPPQLSCQMNEYEGILFSWFLIFL